MEIRGAIAGFAFSATLLTSIVFQFYKQITADEVTKYRDQVMELQSKLVRGAPCPEGFVIEVDERHKLILSRPESWSNLGGFLYQYIQKQGSRVGGANFNVIYQGKDDLDQYLAQLHKGAKFGVSDLTKLDVDKLYDYCVDLNLQNLENVPNYKSENTTREYILVDGIKSLKATHTYNAAFDGINEHKICACMVFTYVPRLIALYVFTFTDMVENYLKSTEIFNNVILSIRFLQ